MRQSKLDRNAPLPGVAIHISAIDVRRRGLGKSQAAFWRCLGIAHFIHPDRLRQKATTALFSPYFLRQSRVVKHVEAAQ